MAGSGDRPGAGSAAARTPRHDVREASAIAAVALTRDHGSATASAGARAAHALFGQRCICRLLRGRRGARLFTCRLRDGLLHLMVVQTRTTGAAVPGGETIERRTGRGTGARRTGAFRRMVGGSP